MQNIDEEFYKTLTLGDRIIFAKKTYAISRVKATRQLRDRPPPYSSRNLHRLSPGTLYETGKAKQVEREMETCGISILGLGKTRWTKSRHVQLSSGKQLNFALDTK